MKKIIVLLLFTLLVACSQSTESSLIGDWTTNDKCAGFLGDGLVFNDDGTMSTKNGELYIEYTLSDDENSITLSNPDYAVHDEYEFKQFDENTISIINPNNAWQDINDCQITKN